MFVFVDGVYQCNRNRDNLSYSLDPGANVTEMSEVVFRVRQKEEQLPDGTWIGKPWRFEPLRIGKFCLLVESFAVLRSDYV